MAIDKAVDSSFLDGGLNNIASAIRDKTGKSDFLAFPDDFVTEISGITGGGGSGESGGYVTGRYIVSSDKTIGTNQSNAIKFNTGLSDVKFFSFYKDPLVDSKVKEYEIIAGIWIYNEGDYYGVKFQQKSSSSDAYVGRNVNNEYTGKAFYNEGNGVMSVSGVTTSCKIFAGTEYVWFAI